MLAHGFGGTKADSAGTASTLARSGYTVITYTARGFGRSGGRIHLDNPAYEGVDTTRIVDLAAGRPEVEKRAGDPVIGFAGASYGGAAALLAGGLDRRVDAIAPAFTWHSLTQALVPQYAVRAPHRTAADVDPITGVGVFKQRWASLFFQSGAAAGDRPGRDLCGRFAVELCVAYLQTAQSGRATPDLVELLEKSSMATVLPRITAPTLLVHGEQDTLFPLDQADANRRGLPATTPVKTTWAQGGHDAGIDVDELLPELTAWFDRYLTDDGSAPDTTFSVVVPQTSLVGRDTDRQPPQTLVSPAYPTGEQLGRTTIGLDGRRQTVVNPAGGVPAALTNLPGSGQALAALNGVGGYPLGVLPGQSATFTSAELRQPLTLVGSSEVALRITPTGREVTLFAAVWDLGPDVALSTGGVTPQTAVLPQLAVAPVRLTDLTPGRATTVRVALPAVATQVPVGHRLRLVVSSTDQAYAVPAAPTAYTVELAGDRGLAVPMLPLTAETGSGLQVPLPLLVVVSLLVLAGAAGLVLVWLRRRQIHRRPDLARVPLVVDGLVKTYADGLKAVDGVSFRAEPGQVVGLLGPNGAGKTTVMRMMVGLIRPDAGSVYVHGDPVHAGADVLASVGAFIEGPGFLPHLTGMGNLRAYWSATGRPAADAHLEEALAIAGLGTAIDRRVRGYSQGMRQRLGIAQAMLGLPSLLLLDEPTNGLDPPQIKAMRGVLHDYAATGRTVVVSSHLLAEVELTCTDVVVMHRGRVVLTGSVPDLTRTGSVTVIGLEPAADLAAAAAALAQPGLEVRIEGDQLRVSGPVARSALVGRLVRAGFGVGSVDGRQHLEDVFMSLVGPGERVGVDG